ncbi:MAG: hypothetical protein PUI29_05580 [Aeromonadales bacterium]|jgi:hypothetical protein|nr:hypothetical protein [Aeromonadales bacterium]MDY2890463.1 hypothetical protein [Succinivibrio sp.]
MARNEALDQARAEVLSRLGLEAAEQGESVRLDFEDGIFATMEGSSDGHAMVLCACCELPEHLLGGAAARALEASGDSHGSDFAAAVAGDCLILGLQMDLEGFDAGMALEKLRFLRHAVQEAARHGN